MAELGVVWGTGAGPRPHPPSPGETGGDQKSPAQDPGPPPTHAPPNPPKPGRKPRGCGVGPHPGSPQAK